MNKKDFENHPLTHGMEFGWWGWKDRSKNEQGRMYGYIGFDICKRVGCNFIRKNGVYYDGKKRLWPPLKPAKMETVNVLNDSRESIFP